MVKNPNTSLHNFYYPNYRLHLLNQVKRKRAMLRSNSPGLALVRYAYNPLRVYTFSGFFIYAFLQCLEKPTPYNPPFCVLFANNFSSVSSTRRFSDELLLVLNCLYFHEVLDGYMYCKRWQQLSGLSDNL